MPDIVKLNLSTKLKVDIFWKFDVAISLHSKFKGQNLLNETFSQIYGKILIHYQIGNLQFCIISDDSSTFISLAIFSRWDRISPKVMVPRTFLRVVAAKSLADPPKSSTLAIAWMAFFTLKYMMPFTNTVTLSLVRICNNKRKLMRGGLDGLDNNKSSPCYLGLRKVFTS